MGKIQVIPNTNLDLTIVERIPMYHENNKIIPETRTIPIVGWVVDVEDYERQNSFVGIPVCVDDIQDGRWGIHVKSTGQVIDQFETVYESLTDFEDEIDEVIKLEDFVHGS